jgi:hypothetical protein
VLEIQTFTTLVRLLAGTESNFAAEKSLRSKENYANYGKTQTQIT